MKFLFLCFIFSSSLSAITLDEIKTLVLERSASLNAQEMEARALESEAKLKGKWQNPQLMGQFGTLKSGNMTGSTVEISFTQPVPLSNRYSLRKELGEIALSNQYKQVNFYKKWIVHQAILSAWRAHVAQELFNHGVDRARRLSLVKSYLESRPRVSAKQRVELALISSSLLQQERLQDQKAYDLNVALQDLDFWTGKKISTSELNLHLPDKVDFLDSFSVNVNSDFEFNQAKQQVTISEIDKELAKKERRPDLFLGAGYRVENVSPVNHFSYGIVGLNIPIWDTGSNRFEAASARFKRDEKNLQEIERRASLKQQQAIESIKFAYAQMKRFPKKIIKTQEQAAREAEFSFKQGILDVNTFLQAETQTHEVIDQVFMSWINYLESLSTLQLMKAEDFSWKTM